MLIRHLVSAALSTAFFCWTLAAQTPCGPSSVRGTWSYRSLGWAVVDGSPVPFVMLGVMVVDHTGKISGPGTAITGGEIMEFELDGKIEVNSSCTAVMTYGMTVPTPAGPVRVPGDAVGRLIINARADEIVSATLAAPPAWGMKANWLTTIKRMSPAPEPVMWPAIPAQTGTR